MLSFFFWNNGSKIHYTTSINSVGKGSQQNMAFTCPSSMITHCEHLQWIVKIIMVLWSGMETCGSTEGSEMGHMTKHQFFSSCSIFNLHIRDRQTSDSLLHVIFRSISECIFEIA